MEKCRYLTVGDWFSNRIEAAFHDDPRSEAAVLIHELVEYLLCVLNDITAAQVDREDFAMLEGKKKYNQLIYWRYHLTALRIERLFAEAAGITWKQHEKLVSKAYAKQKSLHREGELV